MKTESKELQGVIRYLQERNKEILDNGEYRKVLKSVGIKEVFKE